MMLFVLFTPLTSQSAAKVSLLASQLTTESFPYSTSWQIAQPTTLNPRLLLDWSIQKDSNYLFYQNLPARSGTFPTEPLTHPSQVIPFEGFGTLNTPAQMQTGLQDSRHYFTSWQLISVFAYFGGSHDEGQVLAPSPGWIRAAHRNGVKILGTVYFSPDPSESAWIQQFLTQDDQGNYPYAKTLIDIARAYHFDGYFINEESILGDAKLEAQFANFFKYFHAQAHDLLLSWYQVPGTPVDPVFISDPASRSSIPFFIDYSGFYSLTDWIAEADRVSCPRSTLSFGVNAEEATTGQDQKQYFESTKGPNGGYSLAVFDLSQVILKNSQQDPPSSVAASLMQNYWEGNSDWEGAQAYVNRASPLQSLPFSTEFSTGFGEKFYLQGVLALETPWHDLGIQDYLPTRQFDLNQERSNISVSFDFTDAYSAGNSLSYQGILAANEIVTSEIFSTQWVIGSTDQLELIYKSAQPSASLCLDAEGPTPGSRLGTSCYELGTSNAGPLNSNPGWVSEKFTLEGLSGQTVKRVWLKLLRATENAEYSIKLGRLYLGPETATPEGPSHFKIVSGPGQDPSGNWHIYASWDHNPNISYYNLFIKLSPTDEPKLITRTSNTIADYAVGSTLPPIISVQAINIQGDAGPLIDLKVSPSLIKNLSRESNDHPFLRGSHLKNQDKTKTQFTAKE